MKRGERVNNPLNIRISEQTFNGEIKPSADPEFKQFADLEHGIRAGAKILLTYYRRYGLNCVREIINRWAPPSENDTGSYISHVCKRMGVGPDDTLFLDTLATLKALVVAMIYHEQGRCVYTDKTIHAGVSRALGMES